MLRTCLIEMTAICRDSWPFECSKTSLPTGQKQPLLEREQSQPCLHPGREGLFELHLSLHQLLYPSSNKRQLGC